MPDHTAPVDHVFPMAALVTNGPRVSESAPAAVIRKYSDRTGIRCEFGYCAGSEGDRLGGIPQYAVILGRAAFTDKSDGGSARSSAASVYRFLGHVVPSIGDDRRS